MRLFVLFILLCSCATRRYAELDYRAKAQEKSQSLAPQSKKTTVVFLIDGLGFSVLKNQLDRGALPNLARFFLASGKLQKARTVFPSLTFPGISSLLREKPISETNLLGNKLIYQNRLIDFESLSDRSSFTALMRGENIFTRLSAKKYLTVSLDYGLGPDATVNSEFDFQSGYAASQADYRYVDQKKIDSLKIILANTRLDQWPDFIFIHLIAYDYLSHRHGPLAKISLKHLQILDRDLEPVFAQLRAAEQKHQTISMLTSDHGFASDAKKYVAVEKLIKKIEPNSQVLNESRMAALYYKNAPTDMQLAHLAQSLLDKSGIEIVAFKKDSKVEIKSHQAINYPYFEENIQSYFNSRSAPDVVIIPDAKSVFTSKDRGFHGGPTESETMTPLLLRNAAISENEIPPIWQLLKFVD